MNEHELDERLRAALREEDAELLARLDDDPGIFDVVRAGFRGRTAWWVYVTSGAQVAIFVAAVWTFVRFLGADGLDDRVYWGVLTMLSWVSVSMLKLMIWSHVERGMLRREIKRVELQVATLGLERRRQQ
ncbi:MAG: hypothetical protein KAI24_20660 [Planctomycetes bacterium]|nr:hypothetical protein [Planctomycetota bacterium]